MLDAMFPLVLKTLITAVLVVAVAEVAKRSSLLAGFLASLPLVSILALIWLYRDSGDVGRVASLASNIFWMVLPSLCLFLILPQLLRAGVGFYLSMLLSCAATAVAYLCTGVVISRLS